MFFKTFSHIKFLLKSQNQHGLHSPFVYDFVTKGLYKKTKISALINEYPELKNLSKKEQKILSKIIKHFKIEQININKINSTKTLINNYNVLFFSNLKLININSLNSSSCIIAHDIHSTKDSFFEWNKLIKNHEATVTIDLFYFGLIFFRKGQRKEHFIVRV